MTPEVWDGEYGQPADMWSIGVILFVLLRGRFLRTPIEDNWLECISEEAKDLMHRLLCMVPSQLTPAEALCHNFLQVTV